MADILAFIIAALTCVLPVRAPSLVPSVSALITAIRPAPRLRAYALHACLGARGLMVTPIARKNEPRGACCGALSPIVAGEVSCSLMAAIFVVRGNGCRLRPKNKTCISIAAIAGAVGSFSHRKVANEDHASRSGGACTTVGAETVSDGNETAFLEAAADGFASLDCTPYPFLPQICGFIYGVIYAMDIATAPNQRSTYARKRKYTRFKKRTRGWNLKRVK